MIPLFASTLSTKKAKSSNYLVSCAKNPALAGFFYVENIALPVANDFLSI
jgi:hypothetical protein